MRKIVGLFPAVVPRDKIGTSRYNEIFLAAVIISKPITFDIDAGRLIRYVVVDAISSHRKFAKLSDLDSEVCVKLENIFPIIFLHN